MNAASIIADWKRGRFEPIYWLEGEEEYFIDQVMQFAEHGILTDSESSFNLSIFYGKDAQWPDVINACRRYPMFAERQVVLLKEAQQMRDVEKLESYMEKPSATTVFVVSYKDKKLDARKKFTKTVKEKGVVFTTKKLPEKNLPEWVSELVAEKGLTITQKALFMLVDHIGNDLTRISNEIEKMRINLGKRTQVTEDDIESQIGVSKEFNAFELQSAFANRDLPAAIRIIQYFEANPKAGPIQLVLPSLYSFFSRVFMVHGSSGGDEKSLATSLGINPWFMKDYIRGASVYSYAEVEKALLLIHQYNLRSLGIGDAGTEDASLLKELAVQMLPH
jgi:DNA polymerase-3 subunit delta